MDQVTDATVEKRKQTTADESAPKDDAPKTINGDESTLGEDKSISTAKSSTKRSRRSLLSLQQKRNSIEIEKLKQQIEMKKLENRLKILELENEIQEAEIESEDNSSVSKVSSHNICIKPEAACSRENSFVQTWINNNPTPSFQDPTINDSEERKEKSSDMKALCETIADAIKTLGGDKNQNKFVARQTVEKDFPFFDGNPEEWPTFILQLRRITILCEYSAEEVMVKLQKSLRGEAKTAVLGMMASPENVDLVLKTLELRFGRPELIIDGMIDKVKSFSCVKEGQLELLIQFSSNVRGLVHTIKSLNFEVYLQNPQLLRDLVNKLPDSLRLRWGEEIMAKGGSGYVNMGYFSEWLSSIATAASYVSIPKFNRYDKKLYNFAGHPKREASFHLNDSLVSDSTCTYCREKGHKVGNCSRIQDDDVNVRWEVITRRKLCFSCLKNNHHTRKCKLKSACGINGCKLLHHQLLHKDKVRNDNTDVSPPSTSRTTTAEHPDSVMVVGSGSQNILLRMIKVKLYANSKEIETVALCDEASTISLIDQSLIDYLGLEGIQQNLCIQWTNNFTFQHENSCSYDFDISGIHDQARIFHLKNVRSVENLSLPRQVIRKNDWSGFSYLEGLPLKEIDARPMLLLGEDNIRLTVARKVVQGLDEGTPLATKTSLGWILHGPTENLNKATKYEYSFYLSDSPCDDSLHKLVKNTFAMESIGTSTPKNKAEEKEQRAWKILEKTAKRIGDRFEIGLLWKADDIQLPESKPVAFQRLKYVEKQMQKDENFKKQYCAKIEDYIAKKYVRKLTKEEVEEKTGKCWYLPHFGVINPKKPKLRIVFDAASKSQSVSLNDNLLAGPDLLQNLVEILIQFRQRKIAFCADVREMFHQVRIMEEDQAAQRFLWREGDSQRAADVYQMQVMTFGATCSPTSAQYIKNLNAKELSTDKTVLDAICRKHYVDDYLDCTDREDEAIRLITEVKKIQKLGGFELVNWICSSSDVVSKLSNNEHFSKDLNLKDSEIRVLGLTWDSNIDSFCFKINFKKEYLGQNYKPTKREILKTTMSLFDPLGLILNFTIRARILVQDIWKSGIGWDDRIDDMIFNTWRLWLNDLGKIENLRITRCYSFNLPKAEKTELHIFSDASKKAMVTVAYLRIVSKEKIETSLVCARGKVAPIKPLTIPKLECHAALMGSRISRMLRDIFEIEIDRTVMWTDSTTVLYWIMGYGNKLGQFESHRIGEIQELTETHDWRWVPSKLNPADIATRTYETDKNLKLDEWFSGPSFLMTRDETTWPIRTPQDLLKFEKESEEDRLEFVAVEIETEKALPDINRFSKWLRLIRTTAWVLRFRDVLIAKLEKTKRIFPENITLDEIGKSEQLWVKQIQRRHFQEDIDRIRNKKELMNNSRLKQLTPALDSDSILVVDGRTNLASNMSITARRPTILPNKDRYTRLLIDHYHRKFGHQGKETIFNELRQKFWILKGKSEIKAVFSRCRECIRRKAKPAVPLMGQLPTYRLTPNLRPFTYTGVDYFGPILVSVGRRQEKRWGVLFTCLSIRAVHLEVAHSLSTESAIMAVRRMISRRGEPKEIYSDNGTNLRGAAEELKRAVKEINQRKISEVLSTKGISWKFIPPASSHFGGAWERLVRSVKRTFANILKGQVLKDELLLTLLVESEFIVNSRPLTTVSCDPDDLEAITPNHFLLGRPTENLQFGEDIRPNLKSQWRKSQEMVNWFWKRWTKEYLPSLTKRSKWTKNGKPLKKDDIVVILEDNAPRKCWKLGRVETLYTGPDGKIRVCDVKTSTGVLKRPVAKLCLIDSCEN